MTRERGSRAESKNCEIVLFPTADRRFDRKAKCPTWRALIWVRFPTVRSLTRPGQMPGDCPGGGEMSGFGTDWYISITGFLGTLRLCLTSRALFGIRSIYCIIFFFFHFVNWGFLAKKRIVLIKKKAIERAICWRIPDCWRSKVVTSTKTFDGLSLSLGWSLMDKKRQTYQVHAEEKEFDHHVLNIYFVSFRLIYIEDWLFRFAWWSVILYATWPDTKRHDPTCFEQLTKLHILLLLSCLFACHSHAEFLNTFYWLCSPLWLFFLYFLFNKKVVM